MSATTAANAATPEVAFHFNVADRMDYLCRLLRKVLAAQRQALVLVPESMLETLDRGLWTFSQQDFVPHALASAPELVRMRSPVLLASAPCEVAHADVLINTLPEVPAGFERFARVLEIVGLDEAERHSARQRWRWYSGQGYTLVRHDVAQRGG